MVNLSIFYKYQYYILLMIISQIFYMPCHAQKVFDGNYTNLEIDSGIFYINTPIYIKNKLEVKPGAKIIITDPGVIICYGSINIIGNLSNKIEIAGLKNSEGRGLIIKGIDTIIENSINIKNTIFNNLQIPIAFDYGWQRNEVNISNNQFINNKSKVSILQVFNSRYIHNADSVYNKFILSNNLFYKNNSSIYFEDFNSDILEIEISNNTFYNNKIYGSNNYNISSNFLVGRSDELFSKYTPKIYNNSFLFNYLVNSITDTIIDEVNFGVYGSAKNINLALNYWGYTNIDKIAKTIYDQRYNSISPQAEVIPFLNEPNLSNPTHIYSITEDENIKSNNNDIISQTNQSYILKSNNKVDYSKTKLHFIYFKDDLTLNKNDTIINYEIINNNYITKINFKNVIKNKDGYFLINNILNENGELVPDVTIGYKHFLSETYRRKQLLDSINRNNISDKISNENYKPDSIKNILQKIETPLKSRFEFGIISGSSIFLGSISNKNNLFANDKNILFGLNINYLINSNFSSDFTLQSFKLTNSDLNSNNYDQITRAINFTTKMFNLSASLNYDFIDNRLFTKARKIKPSIGLGIDFINFNPTGVYNNIVYNLQELGTGGQFSNNNNSTYSLNTLGYFSSIKIKYLINRYNSIGISLSYHISLSNYLDDVGHDLYPSTTAILNSTIPNKDAAIYFSNPTPSRNTINLYRDNPNGPNDTFLLFGLNFSRRLFK